MRKNVGRNKGDLHKYVRIRDDDLLYRQFADGAGSQLLENLERAYNELKTCRTEAQTAFYHYILSLAVLASVQFGVIDSFQALGATINKNSILYVSLLAGGLLSLRYGYIYARVSFLRAIFEAHSKRLSPAELATWIATHPLGYMSINLYSTVFSWPGYLIPENRRMTFELVNVVLLGLGALVTVLINLAIILGAYVSVLATKRLQPFSNISRRGVNNDVPWNHAFPKIWSNQKALSARWSFNTAGTFGRTT